MSNNEPSKTDEGQSRLTVGLGDDFIPGWANYRQGFNDGLAEAEEICAALRDDWARLKVDAKDGRYEMMEEAAALCEDMIHERSNA